MLTYSFLMYRGEIISTKNKTFLLLILSLLIFAMASVSASDVNDVNDNQKYLSVNEVSASGNLVDDQIALSSADANSLNSNSDLISGTKASADDSKVASSNSGSSTAKSSSSASSNAKSSSSSASDVKSSTINSSTNTPKKVSNSSDSKLSDSTKNATSISTTTKKVVKGNNYTVTLNDKNGNVLSGKKLIFSINGNNYTRTTDSKGIASLTLNTKPMDYIIKVMFLGDDQYESSSLTETVTVSKISTNIRTYTPSAVYKKAYCVYLTDMYGNKLVSKKVTFTFNGKTYTNTTNANGMATIHLDGKAGNTYKLTYKFAGDNDYDASSGSASLYLKMGTKIVGSDASIVKGTNFDVVLKNTNNYALANKKITFTYNGKTITVTSNAQGIIRIKLGAAAGKSYSLTYQYAGSSYYDACSKVLNVFIKTPTQLINSGGVVCKGNTYQVTLKDDSNKGIANKLVTITYGTGTYKRTTNANGVVGLTINTGAGKTYKFAYKFAGDRLYGASSGSVDLLSKLATKMTGSSSTIIKGKDYSVTLKDSAGNLLSGQTLVFTISGKEYKRTTNAKGVASLTINPSVCKSYKFSYSFLGTTKYNKSESGVFDLAVKMASSIQNSGNVAINNTTYTVTLKDGNNKGIANKVITFTFDGKTYNKTTNANGVASLLIDVAKLKTATLTYKFAGDTEYAGSSGSVSLKVVSDKVFSMSQILALATALRTYVEKNHKVPATVSVDGIKMNTTTFAYIMAKALLNINDGKNIDIEALKLDGNYSNNGNKTFKGNLYKAGYLDLAKKLIDFADTNKKLPNYYNSTIGLISPNLYLFGLCKALDFYSKEKYLPNYVILDSDDVNGVIRRGNTSQYKKGLNEVETLSAAELAKYLTASGNDALNAELKALAQKLIAGKSSTWDKANAIFKYVRDNIQYEYYSDTKYKAIGTYLNKRGNCCDHANLIVALFRAAGIPARFSHAQGCTFSSGLVAGHVWAQIYIDGVWYSADATSSRNELGNIHNWNTNSFHSLKHYIHLPF